MYVVTTPTIAARFAALIDAAGDLDLFELDTLAGFGRSGLASQIRRGAKLNPRVATIEAYSAVLGCDSAWLLLGKGAPPSDRTVRGAVNRARTAQGGGRGGHRTTVRRRAAGARGARVQ